MLDSAGLLEVELKLIAQHDALGAFREQVLTQFEGEVEESHATLKNQYFDTPDQLLRQHKMGLRVRSRDDKHQQTLKQKGRVVGGLHQRPEYNVDLATANVDIRLFSEEIWPSDWQLNEVQAALQPLFTTHFHRTTFALRDTSGNDFEVVFDIGDVATDKEQRAINEVELELREGDPVALFEMAKTLAQHTPLRVNDLTKAAFGYALANGKQIKPSRLPYVLPLSVGVSTEDAFCAAASSALSHWQYNQSVYLETFKLQALTEVVRGIRLLLQAFSLYLPVLQCTELLALHKRLIKLSQLLDWQDEIQALRYLRSQKGPFIKRLGRDQALMSYLQGRKEGILNAQAPQDILYSTLSTQLQLSTAQLLLTKPWQKVAKAYDAPVSEHAHGWLSQGWQTVLQAMPQKNMQVAQYLSVESMLRQILRNGYMLAGLFDESREQFRAPWLDLALGLEELNALVLLADILNETDFDEKHELQQWTQDKTKALVNVMEMTRRVAVNADIYW
jgi:triphosphatase